MAEASEVDFGNVGGGKSVSKSKLLIWSGLLVVIIGVGAGAGIGMGGLLRPDEAAAETAELESQDAPPPGADDEYEYKAFDRITVNLNTPRKDRYLQVVLNFKTRKGEDMKSLDEKLERFKPELKSRLITHFSGLTLAKIRARRGLNGIRREIMDLVNEILWPGRRPRISEVLFEEFHIE